MNTATVRTLWNTFGAIHGVHQKLISWWPTVERILGYVQ
jgi:hypothetical protein